MDKNENTNSTLGDAAEKPISWNHPAFWNLVQVDVLSLIYNIRKNPKKVLMTAPDGTMLVAIPKKCGLSLETRLKFVAPDKSESEPFSPTGCLFFLEKKNEEEKKEIMEEYQTEWGTYISRFGMDMLEFFKVSSDKASEFAFQIMDGQSHPVALVYTDAKFSQASNAEELLAAISDIKAYELQIVNLKTGAIITEIKPVTDDGIQRFEISYDNGKKSSLTAKKAASLLLVTAKDGYDYLTVGQYKKDIKKG